MVNLVNSRLGIVEIMVKKASQMMDQIRVQPTCLHFSSGISCLPHLGGRGLAHHFIAVTTNLYIPP